MNNIRVNINDALGAVSQNAIEAMASEVRSSVNTLLEGTGAGNDFLGWVRLPENTPDSLLDDITLPPGVCAANAMLSWW